MQPVNYFQVTHREWKKILGLAVLVALLAVLFSFARPLEYSATLRLLVIQRSSLGLDPYTAIRSAERVSEHLANVVYTSSFFEQVMSPEFAIDQTVFKRDERKRREQWGRMVETQIARGTGILTITTYHPQRGEAERIATAIGSVLQTTGWTYVGGSANDLQVRVVDAPLASRWPVRPRVATNALGGLVLGAFLAIGYIIYRAEAERRVHYGSGFIHE
jgi:capsular polysaccharide biosynthesis protein